MKLDQTLKRHSSSATSSLQPSGASGCRDVPSRVAVSRRLWLFCFIFFSYIAFSNFACSCIEMTKLDPVLLGQCDSVWLWMPQLFCRLPACRRGTVLNEPPPVWLSPQGNILKQFPRWRFHPVRMLHAVLLFFYSHSNGAAAPAVSPALRRHFSRPSVTVRNKTVCCRW